MSADELNEEILTLRREAFAAATELHYARALSIVHLLDLFFVGVDVGILYGRTDPGVDGAVAKVRAQVNRMMADAAAAKGQQEASNV